MLEQAEAEAESSQSKIDQLHQEMDAQAQRHVAMLQAFRPELNKLNESENFPPRFFGFIH